MLLILLLCALGVTRAVPRLRDTISCQYSSCTQAESGMLNVHIVPHTHDDVGWLKTVDQYYYGSRNNIQKAGVAYILDSVIKELWADSKRRFIYVETAFFWKWWMKQTDETRHKVHTLVREGRLQFVGGAWSMNDEAASHYQSIVDQFTWGLHKLNETFGPCAVPHVGWQIDPFGHSREFASLLAAMGYDGLFLGRIDHEDKKNRLVTKTMEMLWRGDDDLGKSSDIFTGVLFNTYSPPPGFCFDVLCNDEPIIDDADSPMFNVPERVNKFLEIVKKMSESYTTDNILITMGEDFNYQDAAMWFTNLDKLIEYTNVKAAQDGLNIKLFYSTPNCYLKAVKDAKPPLPTKQDDFFPYSSDPNAFWTGYFTSRPTTKYFEREANGYLQMVKQLQVLTGLEEHNKFVLDELKSAMGVMQHHDAITGTEKEHVTHDYERILDLAINDALIIARQAFNKIMQGDALKPPILSFNRCRLNESSCATSENTDQFVVTIYNSVAWHVNESIRIPVTDGEYRVYAPNGQIIQSQLVDIPQEVLNIPTRNSKATHEIIFIAYLKPISFKSFYIKKIKKDSASTSESEESNENTKTTEASKRNKRKAKKEKDTELDEINNYWKKVKDMYIDIKKIEKGVRKNSKEKYVTDLTDKILEIPIYDATKEIDDGKSINFAKDSKFDILKDKTNELRRKSFGDEILVRPIKESRENLKVVLYPTLNEEEMRMLSDDPMVVTRYPDDVFVGFEDKKLRLDKTTGDLIHVSTHDGTELKLDVKLLYYPGCIGNNEIFQNRSSGAYIFRPNATSPSLLGYNFTQGPVGDIVKEIRLNTNGNAAAYIRLYNGMNYIEVDWVVGPIDIDDDIGKEYIIRYSTDIVNNGEFYTDSNGRQMLKRKLNKRPQFNWSVTEPIAGNYYPVTNRIFIKDEKNKLAILTDRSEGGSSLEEGQLELMLHRRLLHDDAFGVGEALNETANGKGLVARGRHRIYISNVNSKANSIEEKKQVLNLHLQPKIFVSNAKDLPLEKWLEMTRCFTWVKELPKGIHLLTLEPWSADQLLLRLENYLESSDADTPLIEVDLSSMFNTIEVLSIRETTLAALDEESQKWEWTTIDSFVSNFNEGFGSVRGVKKGPSNGWSILDYDEGYTVKLQTKQIRTFIVQYTLK